ncbi:MAG: alpha/beta hydrolase-fold protein [Polyangiales bacterium]
MLVALLAGCSAPDATPGRDAATVDAVTLPGDAGEAARPDVPTTRALTIAVFALPDNTPPGAAIYAAGTFNDWNPGDPRHRLARADDGTWRVQVAPLPEGSPVEFKLTRGSWATVEQRDDGAELPNRRASFTAARPVIAAAVARWADLGRSGSTVSGDVRELRGVAIPQLGTTRTVWVYLPRGYEATTRRYPVLYMLDGQNLFDARRAAFGREWGVDEAVETLSLEGDLPQGLIVVGVENSSARGCEYNVFADDPHPACPEGGALGDRTLDFFVDTLKPRIDGAYRTLPDRAHTGVAGSSMGGSMAVRAAVARSAVFSRAAALSPSYQNRLASPVGMPGFVRAAALTQPLRVHQDMGDAEQIRELDARVLTANMRAVADALRAAGVPDDAQRALVIPGATHDEAAWSARVGETLRWLWR